MKDRLGECTELTFKAVGIEQWAKENPIKFQELFEALSPEYEPEMELPDGEFEAVFIYNDGKELVLWHKGITITIHENPFIEITKKLNHGDVVKLRIR